VTTPATRRLVVAALTLVVLCAGCGGSSGGGSSKAGGNSASAGDPATDKLAQVLARGTLVLSTDLKYPPQSFAVKGATRTASTKCAENQLTAPEVSGYDADTGKLLAKALGVEPCFVTPTWTEITAGKWADRWDIAYGSGAINADRMTRLWMTTPYRAEAQRFYVRNDSSYRTPSDLDGKSIGVCASCTVESYLKGELKLPGVKLTQKVSKPKIVAYETEPPGLKDLGKGKLAGFLCAEAVGEQAIKDGLPIRVLKEEAFTMYLTGFVDKSSGLKDKAFTDRVDGIVAKLHTNGSLRQLSMKYFGKDYATLAGRFDLGTIGQQVTA
jgi:polar amino acid transport system substrate-binding protein